MYLTFVEASNHSLFHALYNRLFLSVQKIKLRSMTYQNKNIDEILNLTLNLERKTNIRAIT